MTSPLKTRRKRLILAISLAISIALGVALAVNAGSSAPKAIAQPSATARALAWFSAINSHKLSLIESYFDPADRYMVAHVVDWDLFHFVGVHCRLIEEAARTSVVVCHFAMRSPQPPEMQNVSFWDVYMERSPSRPWLIDNYGQG
jgi:hypothetical protein